MVTAKLSVSQDAMLATWPRGELRTADQIRSSGRKIATVLALVRRGLLVHGPPRWASFTWAGSGSTGLPTRYRQPSFRRPWKDRAG